MSGNAAETPCVAPAQPEYLPSAPSRLHRGKDVQQSQARTPCQQEGTEYIDPVAHPEATPLAACHPLRANIQESEQPIRSDPTPVATVTISKSESPAGTLKQLCKRLETHSIFQTHVDPNVVPALRITNLTGSEYHLLYKHLAPQLEAFRMKIGFSDATLIMRRPTQEHESGIKRLEFPWQLTSVPNGNATRVGGPD